MTKPIHIQELTKTRLMEIAKEELEVEKAAFVDGELVISVWAEENCRGRYTKFYSYVAETNEPTLAYNFENDTDALAFKLTWK